MNLEICKKCGRNFFAFYNPNNKLTVVCKDECSLSSGQISLFEIEEIEKKIVLEIIKGFLNWRELLNCKFMTKLEIKGCPYKFEHEVLKE